jgi:predicted component of type VI protein secretion system
MSFSSAFLSDQKGSSTNDKVTQNLSYLLEAISPEPEVSEIHQYVKASNLNFGVPMSWAIGDASQKMLVRVAIMERLRNFEPRIQTLINVELEEDELKNSIKFLITGELLTDDKNELSTLEIGSQISRLSQAIEEL